MSKVDEILSAPPEDFLEEWRAPLRESLKTGDVGSIREAMLPTLQANVITLAMNGASEAVRLDATKFVLGQSGEGVQQKMKVTGFMLNLTNPAMTGFGKPSDLGDFVSEVLPTTAIEMPLLETTTINTSSPTLSTSPETAMEIPSLGIK